MARFEARTLPLANSARVMPTTPSVPNTAIGTMPSNICENSIEMPPTKMPSTAAYAMHQRR